MKKIRIKICKYNDKSPGITEHFIYRILKKYYEVEFSENPDYIFYHEGTYDYLNYNCIRIFYTGENITPNFNFCDYAIGCDYLSFADRFYRLPVYLITVFYNPKELAMGIDTDFNSPEIFTKEDLYKKTDFCSFVYSNYLAGDERKIIFNKLSEYKKVNSGGGYLNNVGGKVDNKLAFEMKHKFSIAFENSSRSGYTTEKLVCSLAAKTIPIYWGNPEIGREFNEKRFINCHNFENFDQVVERVEEIDHNDELYLNIINEPIIVESYNFKEIRNGLDNFLRHIIDQPLFLARRRIINNTRVMALEKNEAMVGRYVTIRSQIKFFLAQIYRPFKKIKLLESFKQRFFKEVATKN